MRRQISSDLEAGDTASAAWSTVAVFAAALDANLDRWLSETYRIGMSEFRALKLLSQAAEKELRVNDLAQRVGQNPSSTTRLISRLEAKGYAHRDVCADDGRGVYAVIDAQGEELLREVHSPIEERVRELLSRPDAYFPHLDTRKVLAAISDVHDLVAP